MKRLFSCLITCCLLISALAMAERQPLERIVAVVDDNIILQSELGKEIRQIKRRILNSGQQPPSDEILRKQVLEHLIVKTIQQQSAKRYGIKVDDAMLNDQINRIAAENGISVSQLKSRVEQDGMNYLDYRETLRDEIAMQQLRQRAVYDRIVISEQEIDDFLAQNPIGSNNVEYKLGHILVGIPETATPEDVQAARAKVDTIFQALQEGANFADTAISQSEGQRALQGGDLGWLKRSQIPTAFAKAVEPLQKGDITAPIRSPSGFHILKLYDLRGEQRRVVQQVHARHILIRPDTITSEEQARKKIAQLRKRIVQGEDFAELAKAHSADGSAAEGGDLGWASSNQYVSAFKKAVDSLPLNKISEPVRTRFGWHLIEVLERRNYDETDEYRRSLAMQQLREQKAAEEEELWLRRLRDQAYVEYRLEPQAN